MELVITFCTILQSVSVFVFLVLWVMKEFGRRGK